MKKENKELKEAKSSQAKVIKLLEEYKKLIEDKLAKKERELMLKDTKNAQEFNDLCDDLK